MDYKTTHCYGCGRNNAAVRADTETASECEFHPKSGGSVTPCTEDTCSCDNGRHTFDPEQMRVIQYSLHATIHALDINNIPDVDFEFGMPAQLNDIMIAKSILIELFGTDEEPQFGINPDS